MRTAVQNVAIVLAVVIGLLGLLHVVATGRSDTTEGPRESAEAPERVPANEWFGTLPGNVRENLWPADLDNVEFLLAANDELYARTPSLSDKVDTCLLVGLPRTGESFSYCDLYADVAGRGTSSWGPTPDGAVVGVVMVGDEAITARVDGEEVGVRSNLVTIIADALPVEVEIDYPDHTLHKRFVDYMNPPTNSTLERGNR